MYPAVPVLMYHQLAAEPDKNKYTLMHSVFREQMRCLSDLGLEGVSIGAFLSGRQQGVAILTFDDGNRSDAEYAWPILRDYRFSATFYVTAGHVSERRSSISWDQLRDLAQSGAEIGCHGRTHHFLDTADAAVLEYEIPGAKSLLEDRIGMPVHHFSLPGGRYGAEALRCCGASGFTSVATSRPGYCAVTGDGGVVVFDRFVLHQGQSQHYLRQVLERDQLRARLDRLAYRTKRGISGLVGNSIYQTFWNVYMKRGR